MSVEQSRGYGKSDGGHGTCHERVQGGERELAGDLSSPPYQELSQGSGLAENLHLQKPIGPVEEVDSIAAGEMYPETQDWGAEKKKVFWSLLEKLKTDLQDEMRKLLDEERLNAAELEEWQKALRRFRTFGEIKERLHSKEQGKILECFSQESADIQKDIIESLEWRRAHHFLDAVVLDSASAHPQLLLSEDQQSVKMGHSPQSLPGSPERFDGPCVLGLPRFTSRDHYWEVKVEGTREWILGVCSESVNRKAVFAPSPESGYWAVGLWDGYRALNTAYPGTALKPRVQPRVVGVFLNYDRGRITFYNVEDRSQLYSFPSTRFHEPLRPVLCMWDSVTALQILPGTESQ